MKGKTNAMRILDSLDIDYNILGYDVDDGRVDGISVSDKIGRPYESVFKTLVTRGEREVYVFIVPVAEELDFKKAARAAGEKKIEMVHLDEILKLTGYIRGGCSPLAMRKSYRTFIDKRAEVEERIVISGGRIGSQIELSPAALSEALDLESLDLIKD